jgi:hypothetical protein
VELAEHRHARVVVEGHGGRPGKEEHRDLQDCWSQVEIEIKHAVRGLLF